MAIAGLVGPLACSSSNTSGPTATPDGSANGAGGKGGNSGTTSSGGAAGNSPGSGGKSSITDSGPNAADSAPPDASSGDASNGIADAMQSPGDAGPNPKTVHESSLQLWLTADVGVACDTGPTPNRVTKWSDQSGKAHDATTPGQNLGPQCNVALHTLHGAGLPYFSNPPQTGVEYLDVDLSPLANTQFTIFAVARVWTWPGYQAYLPFVGVPSMDFAYTWTTAPSTDLSFSIGSVYINSPFITPAAPEPTAEYLMAWFDPSVGMQVWQNGAKVGEDTSPAAMSPLSAFTGGAIGRSLQVSSRFAGDIAEIIVYTAALGDIERREVEGYLKRHWGLVRVHAPAQPLA